jgi:hypothetical protein
MEGFGSYAWLEMKLLGWSFDLWGSMGQTHALWGRQELKVHCRLIETGRSIPALDEKGSFSALVFFAHKLIQVNTS